MQVALLLVSLAASWAVPSDATVRERSPGWVSTCVGSLQLSLPGGRLSMSQSFDHSTVERLPGVHDAQAFRARVDARAAELRARPHDTETGRLGALEWQGEHAAILRYRDHRTARRAWKVQRFLWLGDRGYAFDSVQAMRPRFAEDAARQGAVFGKMSVRGTEPGRPDGFCIDGAAVRGDVGRISAGVSAQAVGMKHVRVWAGAVRRGEGHDAVPASGELAARRDAIARTRRHEPDAATDPEYPREFDVIRHGTRRVAGTAGQEVVWRERLDNGVRIHVFRWTGRLPGAEHVSIGMDAGDRHTPDEAPPDEATLLALWEHVLDSAHPVGHP